MGENCGSSESLDYWRKFFRCTDADIFKVIKNAILVASFDCLDEFLARRDEIAKVLFTSLPMHGSSVGSEVKTPEGGVDGYNGGSQETPKESNNLGSSNRLQCSSVGEFEVLTQQQLIGQVFRIKQELDNWQEESEKVLSELLGWLQLMKMSVKILKDTKIGIVVRGMQKHKSKSISLLARTLVKGWKRLADEHLAAATATATQVNTPDSVNPPSLIEKSLLHSELDFPPIDMEPLGATQPAFEISEILNGMDEDGNPTSTREFRENGRMLQNGSNSVRKDNGDMKGEELNHQESSSLPKKLKVSSLRNTQRQNHSDELTRPELARSARKSQDTPVNAAANMTTQGRQKSSGIPTNPSLRKEVSKDEESTYQYRLEETKRKLQDRYEEAKNAKKQRTVQVVELNDLPKLGQNNQQHKRNNRGYLKRSANMKSEYIL